MRHGNLYKINPSLKSTSYSDPTYEAWKHLTGNLNISGEINSDPTYEAWKLGSQCEIDMSKRPNSDPTYEAWKLIIIYSMMILLTVFRSYLWGMETFVELFLSRRIHYSDPTYEAWKLSNKNPSGSPNTFSFRSYLWGMETNKYHCQFFISRRIPILPMRHGNIVREIDRFFAVSFRSYLWGMETFAVLTGDSFKILFRSYLWGMETWERDYKTDWPANNSDPTYEAWKLAQIVSWVGVGKNSDPTYEAWKQAIWEPG